MVEISEGRSAEDMCSPIIVSADRSHKGGAVGLIVDSGKSGCRLIASDAAVDFYKINNDRIYSTCSQQ